MPADKLGPVVCSVCLFTWCVLVTLSDDLHSQRVSHALGSLCSETCALFLSNFPHWRCNLNICYMYSRREGGRVNRCPWWPHVLKKYRESALSDAKVPDKMLFVTKVLRLQSKFHHRCMIFRPCPSNAPSLPLLRLQIGLTQRHNQPSQRAGDNGRIDSVIICLAS